MALSEDDLRKISEIMDSKISNVESRFNGIETHLKEVRDELTNRLDELTNRLDEMDEQYMDDRANNLAQIFSGSTKASNKAEQDYHLGKLSLQKESTGEYLRERPQDRRRPALKYS